MNEAPLVCGKRAIPKINITLVPRTIRMHAISEEELVGLAESGSLNAVNMAFLGIMAGAFLTLLVTILTVNLDAWKYATFLMLTWGSGIATVIFFFRVYIDRQAVKKKVKMLCGEA